MQILVEIVCVEDFNDVHPLTFDAWPWTKRIAIPPERFDDLNMHRKTRGAYGTANITEKYNA